ncbi:hypothetical protein N7481_001223 [Penicillium waksmanii]|uniref:uncharacterized protein n=1 Tax=Penicillium waksmanii TaxID=69791 RepID=UPI002546864B|nr:uncharacterized protein N7481_001223 [Penicillium waksmanii]KAJ6000814.1 hypothetical protein N7481_001223 [Penicillium waksmanii]
MDWQLQNHRDYVDSRFGWMKEGQFRTADSIRYTVTTEQVSNIFWGVQKGCAMRNAPVLDR